MEPSAQLPKDGMTCASHSPRELNILIPCMTKAIQSYTRLREVWARPMETQKRRSLNITLTQKSNWIIGGVGTADCILESQKAMFTSMIKLSRILIFFLILQKLLVLDTFCDHEM